MSVVVAVSTLMVVVVGVIDKAALRFRGLLHYGERMQRPIVQTARRIPWHIVCIGPASGTEI